MLDDVGPPIPTGPDDVGPAATTDLDGFGAEFFTHQRATWEPIRLPSLFVGRAVSLRIPYSMPGEINVLPNQRGIVFPEATFLHSLDKPFEVHRLVVRLTAKVDVFTPSQQPDTLSRRVRLRISDFAKNENVTKSASLVAQLIANNSGFWEFHDPYTLVRSEGFQVQVETLDFPSICAPDPNSECAPVGLTVTSLNVQVAFQGYLIAVQPASEVR